MMRRAIALGTVLVLSLLGNLIVAVPAQASHQGVLITPPEEVATYALNQLVYPEFQPLDASAIFLVQFQFDGTGIIGYAEFGTGENDYFVGSIPITFLPGTHTITAIVFDTELNALRGDTNTYCVVSCDPDNDHDGIYNTVDPIPNGATTGFRDDRTPLPTTGSILDPAGLSVTVQDSPDPAAGVLVTVTGTGTQKATIEACGLTLRMKVGTTSTETCASLIVEVAAGEVEVELGGGVTVVTVPTGGSAEITTVAAGVFTVENLGTTDVVVTADGVETTVAGGQTQEVTALAFHFEGFSAPVDNPGVLNVVKAGQAVPLRWRLVKADGTPVTNLATASLRVTTLPCADGTTGDLLEEVAAGSSGLLNLGNGYYQLNWKTPKTYAQSCKTLRLDLGEGVEREALFRFTKVGTEGAEARLLQGKDGRQSEGVINRAGLLGGSSP